MYLLTPLETISYKGKIEFVIFFYIFTRDMQV